MLNNIEFGKFPYDKNYQVKIEAGKQQGKSFRAGMEFSNKKWEDKIKAKIEYNKTFNDDIHKYTTLTLEELIKEE